MPGVELPALPTGREFEELVAATFQSSGLFVERDLTQREEVEVLQLDAVTTNYDTTPPQLRLIEAKSGDWGFRDVFKIRGCMAYLNIAAGCLIASTGEDGFESYKKLAPRIGVDILCVRDASNPARDLTGLLPRSDVDPIDVAAWRFVYWVERCMLKWTRIRKKSCPDQKRFAAILDHAFEIGSGIFFSATIAEKVETLYRIFGEYRNLAGRSGLEMGGEEFDTEDARIPEPVFKRTFYDCEFNEVQIASLIEHWARLMLLKAAVDYLSYKTDGDVSRAERNISWKIGERKFWMRIVTFPRRFEEAIEAIAREPHFRRYPVLWQWFLGPLGGFILKDYETQEIERLARASSLPVEAVPDAFAAFDKLFPIEGGWFREQANSNTKSLILYPAALRGIGANYRRMLYAADGKYESLTLTGQYTLADMIRWNNCAHALLSTG